MKNFMTLPNKWREQAGGGRDEEDRGTKEMQTKDLTDILYAVDMAV